MVVKTNSADDAKAERAKEEAHRKRAARQASKLEKAPVQHGQVECTVLPMGDGKISMGEHVGGLGEVHYEEGEKFTIELPIALALYRRGFVNFDGAKDAVEAEKKRLVAEAQGEQVERMAQQKALEAAGLA